MGWMMPCMTVAEQNYIFNGTVKTISVYQQ